MKKRRNILTALIAALMMALTIGTFGFTAQGQSADGDVGMIPEDYEPSYTVVKKDSFEGLQIPAAGTEAQYIWDNTALLWQESGGAATVTHSENISEAVSLVWKPGFEADGWVATKNVLGISANKLSGLAGGYLVRLSFKMKMSGVAHFNIHAINRDESTLQTVQFDSDYRQVDVGNDDDGADTLLKFTDMAGGVKKVELILKSSMSKELYFKFATQTLNADAKVILDDITVEKQATPQLKYRNYEEFIVDDFEKSSSDSNAVTGGIFTNGSTNVSELSVVEENAIQKTKSLKVKPAAANAKGIVKSASFSLVRNHYRLFYKFSAPSNIIKLVNEAGAYVRKVSDGSIVYDLKFSVAAEERIPEKADFLFDGYKLSSSTGGIYTAYGEFYVEDATDVYLEIYTVTSRSAAYMLFDDINVLKKFVPAARPTEMPASPIKPNGRKEATAMKETSASLSGKNAGWRTSDGKMTAAGIALSSIIGLAVLAGAAVVLSKRKLRVKAGNILLSGVLLMTMILSTGCKKPSSSVTVETPGGYQAVYPDKIDGKLDNPGMGWVSFEEPTYGGHVDLGASGLLPEVDNISLSTSWAHIEVDEGVYDFSVIDRTINYWTEQGKYINLRICTDTLMLPYTYKGVPDWLIEKYNVNYEMVDYFDPGPVRQHKVIDIRDKNYLKYLDLFLNRLHEKYKDDPMVNMVEIRGFGVWGEWHHGHSFDNKTDRMLSLETILNKYAVAFKGSGKTLAVCSSWDPDFTSTNEYWLDGSDGYMNYVNWSAFDKAWRLPDTTFRRDSGAALLRYDLDEKIMAEAFRSGKRVPLLGEYATNYANLTNPNNGFDLMQGIDNILYKMRPNYSTVLGWVNVEIADIISKGSTDFIDRGNTKLGYRLAVDKAVIPSKAPKNQNITIKTSWSNSAVGIFPYKAPLKIYLIDESGSVKAEMTDDKFDARTFVQGETTNIYSDIMIPSSVDNGKYKLAIGIEAEGKKIGLGMGGETEKGSKMYLLGEVEVADNVSLKNPFTKINYADIASYKFEKNSTYEVTFRYLPKFDMSNFYFNQNDGYEFFLSSERAAEDNKKCGFYKWQDISGEVGQKTVHFTTGNYSDYKMKVESDSFDDIEVGDVYIENVKGASTNFENYDILDTKTLVEPIRMGYADAYDYLGTAVNDKTLGKRGLKMLSPRGKEKHALAKIDTKNFKFENGASYTVSFDFKTEDDVANGGYFVIGLGDYAALNKNDAAFETVGEWYERTDTYITRKTFTFNVHGDGKTLVFGINMGGSFIIDNLSVTKCSQGKTVSGESLGFKRNVIPRHNKGLGIIEDFESASFQSTGFEWGQFAWGRMTENPSEVVGFNAEANKVSLLGRVEKDAFNLETDNQWFEFVRSKRNYYPLKGGMTYKVKFDYKLLKKFSMGKIFLFFRDDTLPDRFNQVVEIPNEAGIGNALSDKEVGAVNTYEATFTLKNFDHYQFMICMNGLWEIAIDNLLIEQV